MKSIYEKLGWFDIAIHAVYGLFRCRKCGELRPIAEEVLETGICCLCDRQWMDQWREKGET